MNKIGEGYWYNVFELDNSRVRKVEKTFAQKVIHVFRLKKKQPIVCLKTIVRFIMDRQKISGLYQHVSELVDLTLLANPVFFSGIDYEQDKVKQLEDVFAEADIDTQKRLVDQYIDHILASIKYGLFETKFNFLENNGLLVDGSVVLHDFNEVTLDKNEAKRLITIERWQYAYSMRCLPEEIQTYCLQQMKERVTIEELNANWAISLFD